MTVCRGGTSCVEGGRNVVQNSKKRRYVAMPKLSDVEKDELKSFLDCLIENGIEGSNAEGEEQARLVQELLDLMNKTSFVTIKQASDFLEGSVTSLKLYSLFRQKVEAN